MNARTQVSLDPEMQRRAHARAAELKISFAEYVRRLLVQDLGKPKSKAGVADVFDLVDDGPVTNIAEDEDKMLAEAIQDAHARGRPAKKLPTKAGRR
jgi:hypothetical protein